MTVSLKYTCDRCGTSTEGGLRAGALPDRWFYVYFNVRDAHREIVAGSAEEDKRVVCSDCLEKEVQEATTAILKGLGVAEKRTPKDHGRYNLVAQLYVKASS